MTEEHIDGPETEVEPTKTPSTSQPAGGSEGLTPALVGLDPKVSAVFTAGLFGKGTFGDIDVVDACQVLWDFAEKAQQGNLDAQRAMLVGQSVALNAMFTEMARRAAANMGEYPQAMELYMRLSLKAQAQSRATIEALDRLTNGREQTVRHVHVDNRGGQAVIADNVNTGGKDNGRIDDQSHATGAAGGGSALLGSHPFGNGVPVPSRERPETVPDARRHKSGGA
jgi:hypothetical protein